MPCTCTWRYLVICTTKHFKNILLFSKRLKKSMRRMAKKSKQSTISRKLSNVLVIRRDIIKLDNQSNSKICQVPIIYHCSWCWGCSYNNRLCPIYHNCLRTQNLKYKLLKVSKNKYLFALTDNSIGRKSFPKVFCFQLFIKMLVKIINLEKGRKHYSKLQIPEYIDLGEWVFMPENTVTVAAAKIINKKGFCES